jgi:hypothetical protein
MIKKLVKHLERNAIGLIGVISLQLFQGTKENKDKSVTFQ